MSAKVLNIYDCPCCLHEWEDIWDCAANDRCPECEYGEVEPTDTLAMEDIIKARDKINE